MDVLEFSIPHHYVLAALRGPQQKGLDVQGLLVRSGILEDVLHQPMSRVSAQQYTRLIQNIWHEMEDEYMGLGQKPSPVGSFAMMCHAVIHCPNLEKAFKRAFRFYGLFLDLADIRMEVDDQYATIIIDESKLDDPDHFLIESIMVIWHRFGSWLIGRRIHLQDVSFAFQNPPATINTNDYLVVTLTSMPHFRACAFPLNS